MKANLCRITLSLMLAMLMLSLLFDVAYAGKPICTPDGRPALELISLPPNREVTIGAIDQNGNVNKLKGILDDKGNGTFPFGEPGVLYTQVLMGVEGFRGAVGEFKNVKCEPPRPTIESILGDVTRDWGRITDVITDWLTHWF